MVFGLQDEGPNFMKLEKTVPPHVFVKTHQNHIDTITAEKNLMVKLATEKITQLQIVSHEKLNKNRVQANFVVGDFVFVLDRTIVPGSTRPLKTKLNPSPYIVLRPLWTSCLVKRIADGYTGLYGNGDLKKFRGGNPLFKNLPVEITRILLHKFTDLLASDFQQITKLDDFQIPTAIALFEPDVNNDYKQQEDNLEDEIMLFPSTPVQNPEDNNLPDRLGNTDLREDKRTEGAEQDLAEDLEELGRLEEPSDLQQDLAEDSDSEREEEDVPTVGNTKRLRFGRTY
jgi:hypothetical protein